MFKILVGWLGEKWRDSRKCYYGYRMEAIKIVLVRKDGQAPTPTGNSSRTFETQADL